MARCDPDILATLSPRNLLAAYANGYFPMVERGELLWFSPDPRGVLPLDDGLHVPRRLAWTLRTGRFEVTTDRCFDAVVRACAKRRGGTWISEEIRRAYNLLHEAGLAHSFETWPADAVGKGKPAGGLYGVALGGAFFGESMFTRITDAGKIALVGGARRLAQAGFLLYDIQWTTPHLRRFGARDISRDDYMDQLTAALAQRPIWPA